MNSNRGPRPPQVGAKVATFLATADKHFAEGYRPTGKFFHDCKEIAW
jgi:hypothetical protein